MAILIAMLRAVNVGGRNKIKMEALRELCESLKLRGAVTHLNSGNVVFRAPARDAAAIAKQLEKSIERAAGFHCDVVVRSPAELKDAIARNPFARRGLDPSKILVYFLAAEPHAEALARLSQIKAEPEEVHVHARELFIYFPNGMGRPKLSIAVIERALKVPGTGRNWNTVTKLLEIAESLSASA